MSSHVSEFSKTFRLTKASEFTYVFDSAFKSVDGCFLVLARANDLSCARLGMALSKKHIHLAVKRNKTKRLLRESFRRHKEKLKGLDIIVLAQKQTSRKEKNSLRKSIESHWESISKCKKS